MDLLNIKILNPKAEKLLQDLADLGLIEIIDDGRDELKKLLDKIRNNSQEDIALQDITEEVEKVRNARNREKNNP